MRDDESRMNIKSYILKQ